MSAKTKIIVLHMKEVIYTGIFLLLAVILAIVLFFMFGSGQKKSASADAKSLYKPGIYTSSIDLNENTFDLEVTVDSDRVTSIRLVNLSESTAAMFPLMEPALGITGQPDLYLPVAGKHPIFRRSEVYFHDSFECN